MNTTTSPRRQPNATYRGAPMLNAEPFKQWLRHLMRRRDWTISDVARAAGVHERRVRALLDPEYLSVNERTVERFGIALDADPRLAPYLYEQLS